MTRNQPIQSPPSRAPLSAKALGLRIFAFGLLLLGVAVFAWGLKYKLSLYDPPHSASHLMPAAKLLPGPKRTAVALPDLRHSDAPAVPLALAGLSLVFLILGARLWPSTFSRFRAVAIPPGSPQWGQGRLVFSRPPPFGF